MSNFSKNFFINASGLYLGTTFPKDDWDKDIIGMKELESFLETEHVCTIISAIEEIELNKKLRFFRTVTAPKSKNNLLVFNKTKPCVPSDDNLLQNIQTTYLPAGSTAMSLYQSLNNIYAPLLQDEKNPVIQGHIKNLENDLRSIIFTDSNDNIFTQNTTDLTSLSVITSLNHEVSYWNTVSPVSKRDRLTKSACSSFRDILAPLATEFSIIDALSITDAEDLLEKSHNVLEDLWKHEPPYPKDRIKHLMDIIARDVWKFSSTQLGKIDLWSSEYSEVNEVLRQHIAVVEKWLITCKQLTEIFWPNYGLNPWRDGVYQPKDLAGFLTVLEEISSIRALHKQFMRLLTKQEQQELKTDDMFQCFKDIDVLTYGEDHTNSLSKARKQFEYIIQPAERRVAVKLKKQLSAVNANTRQLIYEFSRYSELISRPILRRLLLSERQYLLVSLFNYLKQLQSDATSENFVVRTIHEVPEIVKEISVMRQLEHRAVEVQKVAQKLLSDLKDYEDLDHIVGQMVKELKHQHNELFEAWCAETVSYIKDKTLSLRESDPVVEFSKQKLMRVNYSPKLVVLITEVRQLKAMGYHVPGLIEETSDHAKRFMKFARLLEQIANFHNTIGDRMIPSQKPMMLSSALELSKLVQEQEVVSWGAERHVERYVDTLKTAVEKVSKENTLLTSYHHQIMEKIKSLEQVDLIKEYGKWKDAVKYIKNIMNQVESKGFKNTHTWQADLDKSLAFVLEKKYLESLDTLHLYLPEIHVDLVYRNSKLEYLPNEESLKKTYEQQLQRFLDIPKNFKSVADMHDKVFQEIIENNSPALTNVLKHTDGLFDQLKALLAHWQAWLQLETLDTNKLTSWQHWDLHFRASKTFGQEIAKLPSTEERVGCFLVGLSRLRSDLESHNRSYWDQLVYSLKDSIAQDVVKIQNYVDRSVSALTKQPLTIDELGESGMMHSSILQEAPEMEQTFEEMSRKSQTLSSWSREQIDSVNRLKNAWDRLQSLLENHQHIIAKQMEIIKTTLNVEKENLEKEVERFSAKWEEVKPKPFSGTISDSTIDQLMELFKEINGKKGEWGEIITKKNKLLEDFKKFNVDQPDLKFMDEIEEDLKKEEASWEVFEQFQNDFKQFSNEPWIVIRKKLYSFEDFLKKWHLKLNEMENTQLVTRILLEIHKYEIISPSLKYVRGEDFSEKHWMDTFNILGMELKPTDQLVLNDFLKVSDKLESSVKELQLISKRAASEIVVRQALSELDQWDVQCRFVLLPHKDSKGKELSLIKDFKEILSKIGDNQSLLQSIKNSADYESFSERANNWEVKLGDLDYYLSSLSQIQRKWLYLEPIFGSGTLAQEKNRFDRIERDFRHVLSFIEKDTRVVMLCRYPNLRALLEGLLDQLARCQNSLDKFLKEKREIFPRFLFLSDDDLLEVVGQSSKEHVIQAHLKKLFAGINSVQLSSRGTDIAKMCSAQGEIVALSNPVDIQKPVEVWLNVLVKEMQKTLKELLVSCQKEKQAPDPLAYPSQILCLSDSINFTTKCEQAISSMTLPPLLAKYKAQLNHYSSLELNSEIDEDFNEDKDNVLELKLKALLLDTIHHITVLEELMENNVTKVSDWTWQKQLRYYCNSTGEVTAKMANGRMDYSYEYLGNAAKLVRTPLTDKCFLTLTQGIHLGMGGNPYGPAGTGKTESVKALGGLLGRQVLVFNCDEGIDASSMGRILTGLVKTGAWGCFDEFNRLDEATLSAISMLIHPIQVAIRSEKSTVVLLDQEISVNGHCGIFVTLNPAGGGYGGRNKLPDNLKQLFRPVVMTHPDHEEIARCLLHCDGFQNADVIARKLVEVFDLSSKLLRKHQHYDWGLRSIRTVLNGCGKALKKYKRKNQEMNLQTELGIAVQVLHTDTLSKLTFIDGVKFNSIVEDVFKDVQYESDESNGVVKLLEESFDEMGLVKNERQMSKCLEFYDQLQQRMGIAIVGPPSSGKTTVRNLVLKVLSKMNKSVKTYSVNPKSMTRSQLLGKTNADSNQWCDGVLTIYSLQVASENKDVPSWIICDGDIDPEWVESLNSVLDDNRLLSLPSGWRIQFGKNVNFIFETHELTHASPATISRMGIVFLSEEDLSLECYVSRYVSRLPEEHRMLVEPLINDYFIKAINWVFNDGEVLVPSSKIAIAETGLSQLSNVFTRSEFTVAILNGLAPQLQEDFREIFAQQIYDWTGETPPPLILKSHYNSERNTIDSYYTYPNVSADDISHGIPLIRTGQTDQYLDIMRKWLREKVERHFLVVGPHGSAKTLLLKSLINERSDLDMATIHCTGNLMPSFIISKLFEHCISVNAPKGKILKPKKGALILYCKNLHLLKQDKWGTNILVEFLNQLVVYRGFYDSNVEFVGVENVVVVASLVPTGKISQRFTSNMRIFNVELAEPEDFSLIVSAYLTAILKECFLNHNWPKAKVTKLANTMITIYDKVRTQFVPVTNKHYVFSPHDVTNWCNSLLCYQNNEAAEFEAFIIEVTAYEALSIFGSKLVNDNDRQILKNILNEVLQTQWNFKKSLHGFYYVPIEHRSNKLSKIKPEEWSDLVQKGINIFEREGQILNLIVNDELLQLTSCVIKNLNFPGGNALLIGKSGVGRRSSLKIVSALQSAKLITPESDKQPEFNNDLKMAMQCAGLDGEEVYFLIEDHMLTNDSNINAVSLLMSSGEVPGLYTTAELEAMVKVLKDESDKDNFDGNMTQYFAARVKRKFHTLICLDSKNLDLWNIIQNYPCFTQNCSIIWMSDWSKSTIESVPRLLLASDEFEDVKPILNSFPAIYLTTDLSISTPSRFLSMIKLFKKLYNEKLEVIKRREVKLKAGVGKLTEAENLVKELREKAVEQQKKLEEKQSKANAALDMISNTMKGANSQKEEMEELKKKTQEENVQLMRRKREIEAELADVEPLIQDARSAVGNIRPESLSEIRSLRAPPEVIRDILEGVLRLMGIQDTSWNSMKTFLSKRGVKEEIRSFDATRIATENRKTVQKLMATKGDSFDAKSAKRASVAAAPLAAWVAANVKYSQVLDKIRPLEIEQNKLKNNLMNAEAQLGELSTGLLDVDATVAKLKQQLSAYTKEAAEIEIGLNKAQDTLASAEGLVSRLTEEYRRWQEQLQEISVQIKKLPNDSLLAAAFMTYLSQETETNRREIISKWSKVLMVKEIDVEEFLSTEREHIQWQHEGLSSDKLSTQNAIIILKGDMVPLLIDPTSSATNWTKQHFNNKNIESTTQNSPKFKNMLELAVRFGKTFVIEEIDVISPLLYQILRQEFIYQGERKLIKLNGKLMDYNKEFKLVLCSRNEQLKLPAAIESLVNLMNFTATHTGLTEQLLSRGICQEKPELGERKKQLLKEKEELEEKQNQLQNQLLEDLANSTGNILEDKKLLESLNKTKESSEAINAALVESKEIQNKLQSEYDVYREISDFGSSLYFACNEYARTNVLYLVSVYAFMRLFLKSLQTFQGFDNNLLLQKKNLLHIVVDYVSRGIFKSDRLKFLLHIVYKLFPSEITQNEWNLFLGNIIANKNDEIPPWIPKHCIINIQNLQAALPEFTESLKLKEFTLWKSFLESNEIEFPTHCKLSEFQKVLVIQALRPDKLHTRLTQCVLNTTGLKSLEPSVVDLSQIYKESSTTEPILILAMSGTDPLSEIRQFSQESAVKYVEIALGEGQEYTAFDALKKCSENGQWLILKNLHLVTYCLPMLTQNLKNIQPKEKFRLWLISEPTENFHSVLAQNSLKIVYESSQGIKNNILKTYSMYGSRYVQKLNQNSSRIFFLIACIHALFQERRKYVPQGWSKFYDFSDADLSTIIKLAEDLWNDQGPQIRWRFLSGLCCDAVYGGRIENTDDMKIVEAYARQYFTDEALSHRWKPFNLEVNLPSAAQFEEYVKAIKHIPGKDSPSIFGLPENIERSWESQTSTRIINELKNFYLSKSIPTKFDQGVFQKGLTPFMSLWKKLNQSQDFIRMAAEVIEPNESAVLLYVREEFNDALHLIQNVHKSFASLNKICKGILFPDEREVIMGKSLLNYETPKLWLDVWDGPKEPIQFLRMIINKTIGLAKLKDETIQGILQKPLNLSTFFYPEAFLASYKQDYSRSTKSSIDEISLRTSWSSTSNSLTLTGIQIEGGILENGLLKPCSANIENINNAPDCHLKWVAKNQHLEDNVIEVPLYMTLTRDKKVIMLEVPCDKKDKDKWVQAGLAFYV